MNDTRQDQTKQQSEKKPYTRPELIKHGTVESQTLAIPSTSNGPIQPT